MKFIEGTERSQTILLPERVEDYVGAEHPVRVIEAFVEGLDLGKCGFGEVPAATGRPGYREADLLKLYLWGYSNQVRSSRRLERECLRNLEVIWLMRQLRPDFKTIADFRKDHAKAFKKVFREFVLLCRELHLIGGALVAIDGTKLKAVNNPMRNLTVPQLKKVLARIDEQVNGFLNDLGQNDSAEAALENSSGVPMKEKLTALRKRQAELQAALAEMETSGATQVSLTDADSRRMHKARIGYNAQIAVDAEHHLIVASDVVNAPNDLNELSNMAQQAQEILKSEKLQVVADGGYYDQVEIARTEALGIEVHLPIPHKGSAAVEGRFEKSAFRFDAQNNCYHCPGGQQLHFQSEVLKRGQPHLIYSNSQACRACPIKAQCTRGADRRIFRWKNEAVLEALHARVNAHPQVLARRKAIVEHPFGTIKFWMGHSAFLTRGFENVQGEFSLSCLAYNFKRLISLMGITPLLELLKKKIRQLSRHLSVFFLLLFSILHHSAPAVHRRQT